MRKEHLLIIRFSALGDVAMTVPAVYSLARQYPHLRITVLSKPFAHVLFDGLAPNIDFMGADLKAEYKGIRGLNKLFRRLSAKHFTAVADLHDVLRTKYLRLRFGMERYHVKHIHKNRRLKRQLTSFNHKKLVPLPTQFQNHADVFARLGYPVNIDFKTIFPCAEGQLPPLPEQLSEIPHDVLWIGIAPFAAHQGKVYPLEKMTEVIALLARKHPDAHFFLFGNKGSETQKMMEIADKHKQCTVVPLALNSLKDELLLMAHLKVMVSMDSANMHFASLTATPVISIWGATHPYAGFMGWNQPAENAVQADLSCRPCSVYGNKACKRKDLSC